MDKVIINGKVLPEARNFLADIAWQHRLTMSGIVGVLSEFAMKNESEFKKFVFEKEGDYMPYVKKRFRRTKKEQ